MDRDHLLGDGMLVDHWPVRRGEIHNIFRHTMPPPLSM